MLRPLRTHGGYRLDLMALVAAVLIGGLIGRAILNHSELVVTASVCLAFLIVYAQHPTIAIHAALICATLTLPIGIPTAIHPMGVTVNIWDLLMVFAVIDVFRRMRPPAPVNRGLAVLLTAWALTAMIGWRNENEPVYWFLETRVQLIFIAAIYVAAGLAYANKIKEFRITFLIVVWVSAVLLLASALSIGPELQGRRAQASLNGSATEVARLLTNTQFAALAAVCISLTSVAIGQAKWRTVWQYLSPSLLIVFLSFSRNTLIAVAISLVVVAIGRRAAVKPFVAAAAAIAVVGITGAFVLWATGGTAAGEFIRAQLDAYGNRVLTGIDGNVLSSDNSAQARIVEDRNLVASFWETPWFGHGYGHAYQAPSGTSDFTQNLGRYYAHNFYLWWLVKAGLLGMTALAVAIVWPLLRSLGRPSSASVYVASSFGLLAVAYVAPLPIEAPSSLITGAVIGLALGYIAAAEVEPTTTTHPVFQSGGAAFNQFAPQLRGKARPAYIETSGYIAAETR